MTTDQRHSPRWTHVPGLAEAELDGERVIWDPRSGSLARLDRLGSAIWACLDGNTTLDELGDELADVFEAAVEIVHRDVHVLVHRLAELGLLAEQSTSHDIP